METFLGEKKAKAESFQLRGESCEKGPAAWRATGLGAERLQDGVSTVMKMKADLESFFLLGLRSDTQS